ncbi:hypothetical protein LWI29_001814 [Acer saccharum]|uniref:Uncharacterized protein n=1 Tax=Acer saccharum TaxID=4024 RepID=A0AA39RFB3_ACESA|nr:hypothetical protein LWI29_001814 [Acer saccharum]
MRSSANNKFSFQKKELMNSSMEEEEEAAELRRGPWTLEEDTLLSHYIARHGEGRWNMLAKCAGLKRTGKSCRLRWLNYLKPDIKRGNLTPQEQLLILELHSKWGNRWSKIAQCLPGRTDNEIKNYWRTRVQKHARQLNIESDSKKFLDAVKSFWMPRLLQKIEQKTTSTSSSSSSSSASDVNLKNCSHQFVSNNSVLPFVSSSTTPLPPNKIIYNSNNLPKEISNFETNPSVFSSEFVEFCDQKPEINPEKQKPVLETPLHVTNGNSVIVYNNNCNSQISDDSYSYMDCCSYDMEGGFNLGAPMAEMVGSYDEMYSLSGRQVAEGDWFNSDLGDAFWNMDDIWQFRE